MQSYQKGLCRSHNVIHWCKFIGGPAIAVLSSAISHHLPGRWLVADLRGRRIILLGYAKVHVNCSEGIELVIDFTIVAVCAACL